MRNNLLLFSGLLLWLAGWLLISGGCAQIGFPTGGPRDSLAPVLVKAIPPDGSTRFRDRKVILQFNEYIDLQDLQKNLIISPAPGKPPLVNFKLRNIQIDFRDTLMPNTTYSVQLGDAVRDINENNIIRNFTYVFSTGDVIDSLTFSGKVILAETGQVDSTLWAMLYRNTEDSAVKKIKPDYISRLNGDGNFQFRNLPEGTFRLYALKDNDGNRFYSSSTETFAFYDSLVFIRKENTPVELFAFQREKTESAKPVPRKGVEKKLRFQSDLAGIYQSVTDPFTVRFSNPIRKLDSTFIKITDTSFNKQNLTFSLDSTRKQLSLAVKWRPGDSYYFIIDPQSVDDSTGNVLSKADTVRFIVRPVDYYGRVALRFSAGKNEANPHLLLLQDEQIRYSAPLTGNAWKNDLVPPGDYTIRIFFDVNSNGVWDPGDFDAKRQPERAYTFPQRLSVKGNWDNEKDLTY